jgi:hypothetical protein
MAQKASGYDRRNVSFTTNEAPRSKGFFASLCCGSSDVIDYETDRPPPPKATPSLEKRNSYQASSPQLGKQDKSTKQRYPDRWYLSSKTPPAQLPYRTWPDYDDLYRAGKIDIDDPPLPPGGVEIGVFDWLRVNLAQMRLDPNISDSQLDPPSAQFYPAPKPPNDKERLRQLYTLDVFGRFGPSPNSERFLERPYTHHVADEEISVPVLEQDLQPTRSADFTSSSLVGHPKFGKIVTCARQMFGVKTAMLTCIEDDLLVFLCASGSKLQEVPRSMAISAHTLLGSPQGMVVKDTQVDWRFANNKLVKETGARFYAGVPLYAPQLSEDARDLHALGTLSIIDDKPRSSFSLDDRKKLQRLADLARKDIDTWYQLRLQAKAQMLDQSLHRFHQRLVMPQLPLKQSAQNFAQNPRFAKSEAEQDSLDMQADDSPQSRRAKVFAIGTRSVADTLELPVGAFVDFSKDSI